MGEVCFPEKLAEIPTQDHARERFGWGMGTAAVLAAAIAALIVVVTRLRPGGEPPDWSVVVACATAAPVLGAWEILRRRRRMTLAVRSGQVGIYRQGALCLSLPMSDLTHVVGNRVRRVGKPLLACALIAGMGLLVILVGKTQLSSWGFGLAFFAFAGTFAGSVIRTGLQLHHFKVPNGSRVEEVLLERAEAERLFGPLGEG
jgi:hypothetical protein